MNRCVLDSVLWFHIECPKAASAFDDPLEFKRKWRDFFSQNKSLADTYKAYADTPVKDKIQEMYGYKSSYPEDMKINKKVAKFEEEFRKYSPEKQLWQEGEENE